MPSPTLIAIVIRVLVAVLTRTVFQPDEYFQSLEPAYRAVFGYGQLTWEWLAPRPIRSIAYPALNIPIYWLLKVSGLADAGALGDWLLIACPRVLHGLLAATTDIWLCELTRVVLGGAYVSTALFLSLTSFFHALALSRSLSNSLETSLTTIAFAYYPWDASSKLSSHVMFRRSNIRKTLIFSALACFVRPTNAVIWVFLYAKLLWALRSHMKLALELIVDGVVVVAATLLTVFALDSAYYSKPTFTPLNFLLTNLSSVSLFYGTNPWHYYLTQAIPILCTSALPFALHGAWSSFSLQRNTALQTMVSTVIWATVVYSLAGHKEWRFIHPILPLLHVFAAKSLVDLSHGYLSPSPKIIFKAQNGAPKRRNRWKEALLRIMPPLRPGYLYMLLLGILPSIYVVLFYCSGPISAVSYIRSLPREELKNGAIGVLMPCHSIPGQAYLHREELAQGGMWALGCEPPLESQDLATYQDQTTVFFASPLHYLKTNFPSEVNTSFPPSQLPSSIPGTPSSHFADERHRWRHEWPRYLVFFGDLLRQEGVKEYLEKKGFREVWKTGREWEGKGERTGAVRIWKWSA